MTSETGKTNATDSTTGPGVDIVIVNWNSQSLLRACVAALDQSALAGALHVTIVDNASTDGSADALMANRVNLDLIINRENRGFAAACNQGAAGAVAPYLLFLNPDVRVEPATLAEAMRYMSDPVNSGVGILGIQLRDANDKVQTSCARTPTIATLLMQTLFLDRLFPTLIPSHFLTDWDHRDTRQVDQVMGAFLMIRRTAFEQIAGFDQRFFLYYEDVDLCLAARDAGWAVMHNAAIRAIHTGGGTTAAVKDRRLFYLASSRVEYTAKHHGRLAAVALTMLIIFFEMPMRWIHATVTRSPREGWLVVRAAASFLHNLLTLFRHLGARA